VNDELLVGLDIGTSYSKGVVTTLDGTIVARASRAHDVAMPHPGWAEHDAEAVWWEDLCAGTALTLVHMLAPFRPLYPATKDVVHALSRGTREV